MFTGRILVSLAVAVLIPERNVEGTPLIEKGEKGITGQVKATEID